MILSQTAIYAIRAVIHLADHAEEGPQRVDDIAEALDVPRNYLSKILHGLARTGLLESTRGPRGGFVLSKRAGQVRLADVIAPFDDITDSSGCLLGRAQCSDANPCPAHERWRDVSRQVRAFLNDTTLEDLAADPERRDVLQV